MHTQVCVSGGKKCSFSGRFDMLNYLWTTVLRFALLRYCQQFMLYFWGVGEQSKRLSCETVSYICLCDHRSEKARVYTPHEKQAGAPNFSIERLLWKIPRTAESHLSLKVSGCRPPALLRKYFITSVFRMILKLFTLHKKHEAFH